MKKKNITSQPLPGGGWTLPHVTNLKAAHWLNGQLQVLRRRRKWKTSRLVRLIGLGSDPSLYLGVEMAFVEDAVEAFACFALEAAVNTYGVLRFGEDQFYSVLERLPLKEKMKRAIRDGEAVVLDESDEILEIVGRRVNSRDAIVHP